MAESNAELVHRGFTAALAGDTAVVAALLDEDVRWHGAGDDEGGCQNRKQTLRWMSEAISRGVRVELLEARELPDGRVLLLLQRTLGEDETELPLPHGQILSFRNGKIAEMVVYPIAAEALQAAGVS